MNFIMEPWPWWLSGILIGLTVPLLYLLADKGFGISTSLQQMGAMCVPNSKLGYFRNYDRKGGMWTIVFVLGIGFGSFLATRFLTSAPIEFVPETFYGWPGAIRTLIGGFLIGFGARYAGGCTSGHAITGISNFNWPSLLATVCFFAGGLTVTWGLGHFIF